MTRRPSRVDAELLALARAMRNESAPAEKKLWSCLRDRQLKDFKFRRQHAIDRFVADFYCAECGLVIELDGDSHEDRKDYDRQRTEILARHDLEVARFVNTDVFENLEGVLERILELCEVRVVRKNGPSPQPSPPSTGARGQDGMIGENT